MKLSISGEAQKSFGGTYLLRGFSKFVKGGILVNNKHFWIHQSGGKAIWWNPNDCWMAGDFEYLGSSKGGIKGPSNNDSLPNQITNGWKYFHNNGWHDTNYVHFEDLTFKQGNFFHLLCKNSFQRVHAKFKQMFHVYDLIISRKHKITFLF